MPLLIIGDVVSVGAEQYLKCVVIWAVAFVVTFVRSEDPVAHATGSDGAVPGLQPDPVQVEEVIGPPLSAFASINLLSER